MRTALAVALALATASPMTSACLGQGPMSTIRQSAPASDVVRLATVAWASRSALAQWSAPLSS
jgi:hypothetical protein